MKQNSNIPPSTALALNSRLVFDKKSLHSGKSIEINSMYHKYQSSNTNTIKNESETKRILFHLHSQSHY